MSYSFSARGATKAELETDVAKKMADVVAAQPIHATDSEQAKAAVSSLVDLLPDDDTRDVAASVSGSIYKPETGVESVNLSITVGLAKREEPAAA